MKKLLAVVLAGVMVFALMACGTETTQKETEAETEAVVTEATAEETTAEEASESASADGTYCSDETPIVTLNGEFDKALLKQTILLTSVGQGADSSMMETILKKVGVEYTSNATATDADLSGVGTMIAVVGASSKGLGAAGISTEDEMARAEALLEKAKADGITVILAHIGGKDRRGTLSDQFTELVMGYAQYMLVVEDGNDDNYFTDYCATNNVVITLLKSKTNLVTLFTELFQ